ncbi:hypothetical protein B0A54_16753 [Friedmanniomyces endolithicus]|uniref:Major facilitator superfamily (MFS) profile domain-containing protein n=1 Tax=Friedmanniomyces endolithicus TaxID=329885 RepID=A0A4V6WJS6_9PEZI|nr:hypothetical protein B0A54_16753 [Friedmanniomyces endolithicus]
MATSSIMAEGSDNKEKPLLATIPMRELSTQSSPGTPALPKDDGGPQLARTLSAPPYTIFTPRTKMFIVASVSISSLISPFGATTFYPALNDLSRALHVTPTLINLGLTTYMIAQGIAPAFIAGMSDNNGRRFSFIVCFVIFTIANVGLALQTNYAALLVLRMVQAFGCSAAIALCTAVVADIATSAERGVSLSVLGHIQQRRHARETQSEEGLDQASTQLHANRHKLGFPNPLWTLKILGEKESCIILLYNGCFFTGMIGFATPIIPVLYEEIYRLNTLDIGLCYITMGIGSLTSALTTGHIVDWNFRRHAKRLGMTIMKGKQQDLRDFPIEKARLEVVVPGHIIGTLALLAFGWTLKFETTLAGPEVALYFVGFGVSTAFNITNTLILDLHRDRPATATSAVNLRTSSHQRSRSGSQHVRSRSDRNLGKLQLTA